MKFLLIALLLLGGCATPISQEFIDNNPEYNWDMISKGSVVVGMSKDEILLSWGRPNRIDRASYGDTWTYGISYGITYLYFDNQNILTAWN